MRYFFSVLFFFITFFTVLSQDITYYKGHKIRKNVIILKIKKEYKHLCKSDAIGDEKLKTLFSAIKVKSLKQMFPNSPAPKSEYNKRGEPLTDITLIYETVYTEDYLLDKLLHSISGNPVVEYAEPYYIPELLYVPNDPSNITQQYYLDNIDAYEGWDICKGDTDIVIGVTDTGVELDHEDLAGDIAYNYNDIPDNLDNDNDGYVDNFKGWDLGMNDSRPQWQWNNHGEMVSGIAAASTDNGKGVSGVGFLTRFLPVKISDEQGELIRAYEGIIYAADHDCDIINCSWGSTMRSDLGQDVVNYATYNRGVLVVSASGNDNQNLRFYPACYDNVVNSCATEQSDIKWSGSNYTVFADISAPGKSMYTTKNGTYGHASGGTSYAAPTIAGCAAIVKAYFPSFFHRQLIEQLKVTADNIDTIPENSQYAGLLGAGRVNLYKALTDTLKPSVYLENIQISDIQDELFLPGDTIKISGIYKNYLKPVEFLEIELSDTSSYVQIINPQDTVNTLGTLEEKDISGAPFKIVLSENLPFNENILFKLTFTDTMLNYSGNQYFEILTHPDYQDLDTNNIAVSITSTGRIGYSDNYRNYGKGMVFKEENPLIYKMGLLIGNTPSTVSNCLYTDDHFNLKSRPALSIPPGAGDMEIISRFNEDTSYSGRLNVDVTQKSYAWNKGGKNDFVIIEYTIVNNNTYDLENVYVGLYADWDIDNPVYNKAGGDTSRNLAYAYSSKPGGIHAGMRVLSSGGANIYSIESVSGGDGNIDITNGLSTEEKYYGISNTHLTSGAGDLGKDIMQFISTGPFDAAPGDTINAAFALLSGENLDSLQQAADNAKAVYDSVHNVSVIQNILAKENRLSVYPNPAGEQATITINLKQKKKFKLSLINANGKEIQVIGENKLPSGQYAFSLDTSGLPEGLYYIVLNSRGQCASQKLMILK